MGQGGRYLPSQSLRNSSPRVGAKGDEENGLPHQSADWFAMTTSIQVHCKNDTERYPMVWRYQTS